MGWQHLSQPLFGSAPASLDKRSVTLLDAADAHSPRLGELVSLLTYNGVRIDEALAADVTDCTYQNEGTGSCGSFARVARQPRAPLNPITVRALDAYMADDHSTSGPLFLDRTKSKRLAYTTAYEMIQRLARKAGIPAAESITPHSFRHTFIIPLAFPG